MKISMKIYAREHTQGLRAGDYELPEGTTVAGLIEAAEREAGITLPDGNKKVLLFLMNGKPVKRETVLHDGDAVKVLKQLVGG